MCLSTQMIISLTLYQMSDICVSGSLSQSPPHRDQPCWVRAASQARWGVLCELRLDRSINRIGALRMYFECSMSPWMDSNDVSRNVIKMMWSISGCDNEATDKQLHGSDWWPGHHHPHVSPFRPPLSPLIVLRHILTNETISQSSGQHRSLILHPYL